MADKRIPAAKIRAAWFDLTLSVAEAAERIGLSRGALYHRARRMGLPQRRPAGCRIDREALLALWLDPRQTNEGIAEAAGYDRRHLSYIAARLNLPPRPMGPKIGYDQEEFARMYHAGISLGEISRVLGRERSTLVTRAQRLGLPPRGAGFTPVMTLQQYLDAKTQEALRRALEVSAAETRAAMVARQKEMAA